MHREQGPTAPRRESTIRVHYYRCVRRVVDSIGIAVGIALLFAACNGPHRPRIGSAAPDFTVQDSQQTITLSQLRGQVVVLNFWATWCAPCMEEMPSLVEMQRRMKDKGVIVLAVSVDSDENAYRQFVKNHGVNLLTGRDADHRVSGLYGSFKFPETYVIDRNGVMQRKFIGAVEWTSPTITDWLGKL
jgi:cytochrome c biogenesis protein CcmG/thiol:disulfide interchange protein DsbE